MTASRTKHVLWLIIRAVVSIVLAFLLIRVTMRTGDITPGDFISRITESSVWLLLAGFLLYGLGLAFTVIRWRVLLHTLGITPSFSELVRLTMIGVFFNIAIPGAVSGDLIKMGYLARQTPGQRTEAILTILLDRILGLLGLFVLAAALIAWSAPQLLSMGARHRAVEVAVLVIGIGSFCALAGVLLLEFRQKLIKHRWIARLVDAGRRNLPGGVVGTIKKTTDSLELYRNSRRTLLFALMLAVGVHVSLGVSLLTLGRAAGEQQLRVRTYMLTMQVGNVVGSVPVTPGGLGTRDATVAGILKAFGPRPQNAASLAPLFYSAVMVLWSLLGAIVFAIQPTSAPTPDDVASEPET